MKKTIKRLLLVAIILAFTMSKSTINAFASEETDVNVEETESHTIVIYDEEGNATYQTVTTQTQSLVDYEEFSIVGNSEISSSPELESSNEISSTYASNLASISENRAAVSPYKYCCLISSSFSDGEVKQSSGILLGKNVVLTSAHGVYDINHGGNTKSIIVSVGVYYNSSGKFVAQGRTVGRKLLIVEDTWVENQKASSDWALIILDEDCIYSSYPKFARAANDYTQLIDRHIELIGYPGERFCFSRGKITGTTDYKLDDRYKGLWTTSAESSGGMSGGPMIDIGTGAVIGVIKGKSEPIFGSNVVVPLTEFISTLILSYANQ